MSIDCLTKSLNVFLGASLDSSADGASRVADSSSVSCSGSGEALGGRSALEGGTRLATLFLGASFAIFLRFTEIILCWLEDLVMSIFEMCGDI